MATREELEAIRERADIVEIISRYLKLEQSGNNYKGRCPFHDDRTPSFVVNREKGLFHCFGCGAGGDLFGFLMRIEHLNFPEAVVQLADQVGVTLSDRKTRTRSKQRDRLRELNRRVSRYLYYSLTRRREGRSARVYLKQRGFRPETLEKFRLGYALASWDDLLRTFQSHGYRTEELEKLGLVVAGDDGYYDRFRDRLIFTILDLNGEVAGFAGRTLSDEAEPKYINLPHTPFFDKGGLVYGLNLAKECREENVILVEGYTDAISLHQAGMENVVASMGTALTERQAKLLKRFFDRVVIAYDRDTAGSAACLRGMQILRNAKLDVAILDLPAGEDPDSFIHNRGVEMFLDKLERAVPFHRFYVEHLNQIHDLKRVTGQERALEETREFLRGIDSLPLRHEIIEQLAALTGLPEEALGAELMVRESVAATVAAKPQGDGDRMDGERVKWCPEEYLLFFLLQGDLDPERAQIEIDLSEVRAEYQGLFHRIFDLYQQHHDLQLHQLIDSLEDQDRERITRLALTEMQFSDREQAIKDELAQLTRPRVRREIERLRQELMKAEGGGERERAKRLREELFEQVQRERSSQG
ncbi:MAG: DNA primase [Candidatus Bipolaricaulia bacterium]